MALHEKGKRPKNMDEWHEELTKEKADSLDDAVNRVYEFQKPDIQAEYLTEHFQPAMDNLYNTFVKHLNDNIGSATEKISGEDHRKIVDKALLEGLKEYMKITNPSILEVIDELELDDEEALEHLSNMYDRMHGNDGSSAEKFPISERFKHLSKDKNMTIGELVKHLLQLRAQDPDKALQNLNTKYTQHHLGSYEKHHLLKQAYNKVKDSDYEIDDKVKFVRSPKDNLIGLITAINTKDYEKINLDQYGLKKKVEDAA